MVAKRHFKSGRRSTRSNGPPHLDRRRPSYRASRLLVVGLCGCSRGPKLASLRRSQHDRPLGDATHVEVTTTCLHAVGVVVRRAPRFRLRTGAIESPDDVGELNTRDLRVRRLVDGQPMILCIFAAIIAQKIAHDR